MTDTRTMMTTATPQREPQPWTEPVVPTQTVMDTQTRTVRGPLTTEPMLSQASLRSGQMRILTAMATTLPACNLTPVFPRRAIRRGTDLVAWMTTVMAIPIPTGRGQRPTEQIRVQALLVHQTRTETDAPIKTATVIPTQTVHGAPRTEPTRSPPTPHNGQTPTTTVTETTLRQRPPAMRVQVLMGIQTRTVSDAPIRMETDIPTLTAGGPPSTEQTPLHPMRPNGLTAMVTDTATTPLEPIRTHAQRNTARRPSWDAWDARTPTAMVMPTLMTPSRTRERSGRTPMAMDTETKPLDLRATLVQTLRVHQTETGLVALTPTTMVPPTETQPGPRPTAQISRQTTPHNGLIPTVTGVEIILSEPMATNVHRKQETQQRIDLAARIQTVMDTPTRTVDGPRTTEQTLTPTTQPAGVTTMATATMTALTTIAQPCTEHPCTTEKVALTKTETDTPTRTVDGPRATEQTPS